MEFDEKTTLKEILEFSELQKVLEKHNIPCLGCAMAKMEMEFLTLGQICSAYGIDLKNLVSDLNKEFQKYDSQKT